MLQNPGTVTSCIESSLLRGNWFEKGATSIVREANENHEQQ